MAPSRRLPGLDGLRGLAAAAIVLLHVWMYTAGPVSGRPHLLNAVIGELRMGVTLFFVISGYLLAGPWVRSALDGAAAPRLGRYALSRAARVLPAYWVAMAGAFLVLTGSGHPREADASGLWAFALLVQNHVAAAAGKLDPPAWSLGIEVSFYAALPLIGWGLVLLARRRGRRGIVAAAGALAVLALAWRAVAQRMGWSELVTTSLPSYLPIFASAIGARALAHGRSPGLRARAALLLAGAAVVLANSLWHAHGGTGAPGQVIGDLPGAIGFAAIVAALAAGPGGVLEARPLRALGAVSYGVYLWHMPVLFWLHLRGLLPDAPAAAFAAVAAPTLALAAASWFAVERPCLRLLAGRRRAAAAGAPNPQGRLQPSYAVER